MKGSQNLLIGAVLGLLIGWTLGFLRLPYLDKNFSFLLGFLACLALISLVFIFFNLRNGSKQLRQLAGKEQGSKKSILWMLIFLFLFTGGTVSAYYFIRHKQKLKALSHRQTVQTQQQSELIASSNQSAWIGLLDNLLVKVEAELDSSPERGLRAATIGRIASLSYSFKPYRLWDGKHLTEQAYSPERAQLLLALAFMEIETETFEAIKWKTSFAGADLRKADLQGLDLSYADLRGAYLADAVLTGTNLTGADLSDAQFHGADLSEAQLFKADMERSVLDWATLNEANLDSANMQGVQANNAKFKKASMQEVIFKWGFLNGASLAGANLEKTDFLGCDLQGADFSETNLTLVSISRTKIQGANFTKATFDQTAVHVENWLDLLTDWQVMGAEGLRAMYQVVEEKTVQSNYRVKAQN